MKRLSHVVLPTLVLAAACMDPDRGPLLPVDAALAKGAPTSATPVEFTINGATSLASDGKGVYRNAVCGVQGTWSTVLFLSPTGARIPKSQQASCAGLAPRAATVRFETRHISDDPHVDEAVTPATYSVANVKFGSGTAAATTINSTAPCGTAGLRYASVTYPGSDDTIRDDLGGGLWHMYTRPWPNNRAYCENGGVVTFWHISLDIDVRTIS